MIEEPVALTIKKNITRPTPAQIAGFQGVPTGFVVDALGGTGQLHKSITPIGDGRDFDCIAAGACTDGRMRSRRHSGHVCSDEIHSARRHCDRFRRWPSGLCCGR